jgi:DNA-binding XRE family transcriptional regulator
MNGHLWTIEEIKRLAMIYETATNEQLAKEFKHHTLGSIRQKAKEYGMKFKRTTKRARYKCIRDLWDLRLLRGQTREQLAEVIGLHPMIISRYERGETTPSLRKLHDWCEALNVTLSITSTD